MTGITFMRDHIALIDWAFLPDSIFDLARFHSNGTIMLVANADKSDGKFIPMGNPDYQYANSYTEFKRLATEFLAESTS